MRQSNRTRRKAQEGAAPGSTFLILIVGIGFTFVILTVFGKTALGKWIYSAWKIAIGLADVATLPPFPDTTKYAIIGVAVGGLAVLVRWAWSATISALHVRSELQILETLADGRPRSRDELKKLLRSRHLLLWVFLDVHNDAISSLYASGKIRLNSERRYFAVEHENATATLEPYPLIPQDKTAA